MGFAKKREHQFRAQIAINWASFHSPITTSKKSGKDEPITIFSLVCFTRTENLSILILQKKLPRDISKNCSSVMGCKVEIQLATTYQIKLFLELSNIFISVIFNNKKDACI